MKRKRSKFIEFFVFIHASYKQEIFFFTDPGEEGEKKEEKEVEYEYLLPKTSAIPILEFYKSTK